MMNATAQTIIDRVHAGYEYRIASIDRQTSFLVSVRGILYGGTNSAKAVVLKRREGPTLELYGELFELEAAVFAARVIEGEDLPHWKDLPESLKP